MNLREIYRCWNCWTHGVRLWKEHSRNRDFREVPKLFCFGCIRRQLKVHSPERVFKVKNPKNRWWEEDKELIGVVPRARGVGFGVPENQEQVNMWESFPLYLDVPQGQWERLLKGIGI